MSIHVCVCIYIYMDVCVWVSLSVRGWVAKEEILSSAFLIGVRVSTMTPLSILAQRPHKELCMREPARPEESMKDIGQLRVRLQSIESYIQARDTRLVSRI